MSDDLDRAWREGAEAMREAASKAAEKHMAQPDEIHNQNDRLWYNCACLELGEVIASLPLPDRAENTVSTTETP